MSGAEVPQFEPMNDTLDVPSGDPLDDWEDLSETPGTLRLSSPKRVGPLLRKTQRIYVVHGPIRRRRSESMRHPTGLFGTAIATLQC